jgi:hypothetical protein
MIQRIQSVYLLLTALLSGFFLNGSYLNLSEKSGAVIKVTLSEIIRQTGSQAPESLSNPILLTLFIALIPLLALITIFLFKKRTIQLWLAGALILLIAGFIIVSGIYTNNVHLKYSADLIIGFKMIVPVFQLVFAVLAFRGIKKDEELVKSYDRLR